MSDSKLHWVNGAVCFLGLFCRLHVGRFKFGPQRNKYYHMDCPEQSLQSKSVLS